MLFVFQFYPVYNFAKLINFILDTVRGERVFVFEALLLGVQEISMDIPIEKMEHIFLMS